MSLVYKKSASASLCFFIIIDALRNYFCRSKHYYFCRSNHASLKKVKCQANKQHECFLRSAEQSQMISVTYTLYFPRCREIELIPHINQFKFPKKEIWKNEKPMAHYKYDIQNTHVSKNYKIHQNTTFIHFFVIYYF